MPKLTTLKTGIATLGGSLSPTFDTREQQRSALEPWRAWYKTNRWRDLRWDVLLRDKFTCRWNGCGRTHHDTSNLVAHHIERHRGNPDLFWSKANLMCVCDECHDGPIKAAERAIL